MDSLDTMLNVVRNNVKKLREYQSITQADLAEKAEISQRTVINFENEKDKKPMLDSFMKIAVALDAHPFFLFNPDLDRTKLLPFNAVFNTDSQTKVCLHQVGKYRFKYLAREPAKFEKLSTSHAYRYQVTSHSTYSPDFGFLNELRLDVCSIDETQDNPVMSILDIDSDEKPFHNFVDRLNEEPTCPMHIFDLIADFYDSKRRR